MKDSYWKKREKIKASGGKHIPNKKEAALLRRLMSETGKTEEEIRSSYKYRKRLSLAAKPAPSSKEAKLKKHYKYLIRLSCAESGYWQSHPETLRILQKWFKFGGRGIYTLTFEEVVKRYISK